MERARGHIKTKATICAHVFWLCADHQNVPRAYFKITEEGGGVLQAAPDVEGDHSWTPGALSLHELVLGVRGQACAEEGGGNGVDTCEPGAVLKFLISIFVNGQIKLLIYVPVMHCTELHCQFDIK